MADDHSDYERPSDPALRVKALESLLIEKGLVDPAALDAYVDYYAHRVGPRNGARVVARAWVDAAYRQRLPAGGRAARAGKRRPPLPGALGGADARAHARHGLVEQVDDRCRAPCPRAH